MSTFTLALSCLTTSNLPWFTDLTFQVPMQYCSLQHRTLLLHTEYCFCFGSIPSFFLELFLHWSPVAYWAPTHLGNSSFSILSFCLFILFTGFSRQEYWSGLPFPSPVDHILSDLSTMTCPSWVAPHGLAEFHWVRQGCGPCDQIDQFSVRSHMTSYHHTQWLKAGFFSPKIKNKTRVPTFTTFIQCSTGSPSQNN